MNRCINISIENDGLDRFVDGFMFSWNVVNISFGHCYVNTAIILRRTSWFTVFQSIERERERPGQSFQIVMVDGHHLFVVIIKYGNHSNSYKLICFSKM